jgi:hypothetical protein
MDAPSPEELNSLQSAGGTPEADSVVHWRSAFGLIIIETRGGHVFVNGQQVQSYDALRSDEHT